jgi:TM2 domain-containing membrane protein YozV
MNEERLNRPGLAAVLSFVFNGLGQIYNGQIIKGLLVIFFSSLSMLILLTGAIFIGFWMLGKIALDAQLAIGIALFITGLLFICIVGIYSIFDAYRVALKK